MNEERLRHWWVVPSLFQLRPNDNTRDEWPTLLSCPGSTSMYDNITSSRQVGCLFALVCNQDIINSNGAHSILKQMICVHTTERWTNI